MEVKNMKHGIPKKDKMYLVKKYMLAVIQFPQTLKKKRKKLLAIQIPTLKKFMMMAQQKGFS